MYAKGHYKVPIHISSLGFPGGKIEEGETEQEALHRELLEEMDYDVSVVEKLCTVEHTYPDFSISMHAYICSASSRKFTRKEHAASIWLKPEDLESLEWCEADKPIVTAIITKHMANR